MTAFIRLIFVFLLVSPAFLLQAQQEDSNADLIGNGADRGPSLEAIERQAFKAQRNGDHSAAMGYFAKVIQLDSTRIGAYKGFAAEAVELYMLPEAEKTYTFLAYRDPKQPDAEMMLKLAEVRFKMEDYDGARDLYDQIRMQSDKNTPELNAQAEKGYKDADWAINHRPIDTIARVIYLGKKINTSYYAEYSPVLFENILYFSAYRFPFPTDKHNPHRHLVKVMTASASTDTFITRVEPFNNNERHTAHVAFSRDGQRMYFAQCDFINEVDIRCELYMSRRNPDKSWGSAEKLPEPINLPEFTSTEPNIGWDDKGNETLYFVSDRPGDGKRDIWATEITGSGFGPLENLKEINTEGDEVTPCYQSAAKALYFSSDSYSSLGGLDVFRAEKRGNNWSKPVNLGNPVNSGYNDVFYHPTPSGKSAYMASNRLGDYNKSEEGCCYDLFKVQLAKPEIIAVTFNAETGDSLSATKMRLFEVDKDKTTEVEVFNEPGNHHYFQLRVNQPYRLIASKPYFKADTVDIAPISILDDSTHVYHLYLDPAKITLNTHVFQRQRDGSVMPCDSSYATFKQLGNLVKPLPQPVSTLDSLKKPGFNTYTYGLDFDKGYEVHVTKPGFTPGQVAVTTDFYTENDTVLEREVILERRLTLVVTIINGIDNSPLMPTLLYLDDLQANTSLSTVNLTSNKYVMPVKFGGRYAILGEAQGFYSDSLEFATPKLGKKPNDTIYQELILFPACLKCYTPITLFFENDRPYRIDLPAKAVIPQYIDSTKTHYFDLWTTYLQQEEEYIAKHTDSKIFTGELLERSVDSLHRFFADSVRGNGVRLNKFMEIMDLQLTENAEVKLIIKGFASPIAGSEYNRRLTNRRITSLTKWMLEEYRDSLLIKYYKPTPPAKQTLKWDRIANGESQSANIPDGRTPSERKWSVYSVQASVERKVQVADVIVTNPPKLTYRDASKVPPRPAIISLCCPDGG